MGIVQARPPEPNVNPDGRLIALASYLLALVAALPPRLLDLGTFVTIDEVNAWMLRSERFGAAIMAGDLGATAISAHPGATTMWLGWVGIRLHELLAGAGLLADPGFAGRLALMQLPLALVGAAGVLAGLWLLRRLFTPWVALLGALLWALDPFVIGLSRVLHVDGLVGTLATLAILAASYYWRGGPRWALIASGLCAGAAVVTKAPAIVVAPAVAGIALLAVGAADRPGGWRAALRDLLIWALAATVAALSLWPALWADPGRAVAQLTVAVTEEGGEPHQSGNFFLGRSDDAPGPTFYPVAAALRLTPWALIGLLLLPLALGRLPAPRARTLAGLAGFALALGLLLTVFPKKFDRYLVPAFPALDLLAAAGISGAAGRLPWRRAGPALAAGIGGAAALNAAWWHPYSLVAANQFLGGAPVAARTLRAGWGEGMAEVASWLNRQPNITEVVVAGTTVATLRPYLREGAFAETPPVGAELPPQTGYAVVYIRSSQPGAVAAPFDRFYPAARPVHTVRIAGVDYARIYEVVPEPARPLVAQFGDAVSLRGVDPLDPTPGTIDATLYWETAAAPAPGTMLFAHLIGPDGQRYAQIDVPLTEGWEPDRHYVSPLRLPIPDDLPGGRYRLAIGLYDANTGQRQPLFRAPALDPEVAGPDALLLSEITIPPRH